MGRGKNNRRRASLDGPAPTITTAAPTIALKNNSICTEKDTNEEIEYHFKNLPCDLKQFLLTDPHTLPGLTKFLDYWTHPTRVSMCSQSIAASICGCSWYLSNLYMSIGKVAEARALLLNGCFLQQCYVSVSYYMCHEQLFSYCHISSHNAPTPFHTTLTEHTH